MGIPVLTILLLIFVVWLQYEIRKNSSQSKNADNHFWEKEKAANQTRRKDITNLQYLTLSLNTLPMEDHADDTINSYRDTIKRLSDQKIVNLTGLTNTELKSQYGAANLNLLCEYDNNYTVMVSILQKWAVRLYQGGFTLEAQSVLEYSVSCQTDVTGSYRLLAEIYHNQKQPEKIHHLIEMIPRTRIPEKDKLIAELSTFLQV